MRKLMVLLVVLACVCARAQMQIEAENVIVNREATNLEELLTDKWNIWSMDVNKRAWAGGVVVRSPITRKDHQTHDEGAPILHIRIPLPSPGVYSVDMQGSTREIGLSLDGGKTWQPFTCGLIAANRKLDTPYFDCWFDDCYTPRPPNTMGPAYIDYFNVAQVVDVHGGVSNPDFELGKPGEVPPGWYWYNHDRLGGISIVDGGHHGKQAMHIETSGGNGWAAGNAMALAVKPGEVYIFKCWVKGKKAGNSRLEIKGYRNGIRASTSVARSRMFPSNPNKWQLIRGFMTTDEEVDTVMLRIVGNGEADLMVDDFSFERGKDEALAPKPLVQGHAKQRITEKFGRGVVAQETGDKTVYVSWRLLKEDAADTAFEVFRRVNGKETKLTSVPLKQTCDFTDNAPVEDAIYVVRPTNGGAAGSASVWKRSEAGQMAYKSFKLSNPEARVQKVAIADLNGDGEYDYVVKHPQENIDPWNVVWYKSPDTYKLEAFLSDGTRLWTKDLGWDIERGIWYSPYCAYDLDGDGKAEVITKISEGDHREPDGHVYSGDESFAVLDGMTGEEIDRAPWIKREHFGQEGEYAYGFSARNLMCIALLDGKTPCICIMRGTYGDMCIETWQLVNRKLQRVWTYDNAVLSSKWYGQGAHTNYALDVDGDGRDEIVLGSAVIDDNGMPLWSTGKGHPDGVFFGKLRPDLPGLQVAYVMETPQKKGGLCMADAATGKLFWELQELTHHVDGKGLVADIDPLYPGVEIAGADMHILEPGTNKRGLVKGWLMTADGKELENTEKPTYRYGVWTIYWDADLQKELLRGRIMDAGGGVVTQEGFGGLVLIADVLGDWREEIISSPVKGEFRIYSTCIPAMDRRPCLMQEHNYRMRMVANAMGYNTEALLPYDPEAESPNLNLTCQVDSKHSRLQVVVVASLKAPLRGHFKFLQTQGLQLKSDGFEVDLKPGERMVRYVDVSATDGFRNLVKGELTLTDGTVLRGQVPARIPKQFLTNGFFVEAEAFTAEQGGEIHVRTDKPGVRGKCLSHWDNAGHRLTWTVTVPADGSYTFVARYSNPTGATRQLKVDDKDYGTFVFAGTRGFGDDPTEWEHFRAVRDGKPVVFELKAGKHTITLENTDGIGTNLDYLGFVK